MTQASSVFQLPPIPESLVLPDLPPIEDERLVRQVFTHTSYAAAPRSALNFFETREAIDSEKLEHVGDALLGCVVTILLHRLYPQLKQGPATALKSYLVRDTTLAQLSRRYDLPSRLIASPSAKLTLLASEKTVASIFEAYIAGLFQSYLTLKASDGSDRTEDDAQRLVAEWLRQLFTPLAAWTLDRLKEHYSRQKAPEDSDSDELALGALQRLNQHFVFHGRNPPTFSFQSELGQWSALCEAVLKDGTMFQGQATRGTKQAAKTMAAWKICQQLDLK